MEKYFCQSSPEELISWKNTNALSTTPRLFKTSQYVQNKWIDMIQIQDACPSDKLMCGLTISYCCYYYYYYYYLCLIASLIITSSSINSIPIQSQALSLLFVLRSFPCVYVHRFWCCPHQHIGWLWYKVSPLNEICAIQTHYEQYEECSKSSYQALD